MATTNPAQPRVTAEEMKRAEKGAEQNVDQGASAQPCETCGAADCAKKIEAIEKETNKIADIKDPIERNKEITAAYTKLAAEDPQNRWIKLASIVSVQGGCAMKDANFARYAAPIAGAGATVLIGPAGLAGSAAATQLAQNMYSALGDANKAIFTDIYPHAAYRARHGYEDMKRCYAATGKEIPPRLQEAFEKLEEGNLPSASDTIAEFEQRTVVQRVYEEYSGTFSAMERMNSGNRWFSEKNLYDIPVSTRCGDPETVPFVGSLSNPSHRVDYYRALMDRLSQQQGWKQ